MAKVRNVDEMKMEMMLIEMFRESEHELNAFGRRDEGRRDVKAAQTSPLLVYFCSSFCLATYMIDRGTERFVHNSEQQTRCSRRRSGEGDGRSRCFSSSPIAGL